MARPKEFDEDLVLEAAIGVFREHGFEGTSTEMLVCAMGINRQSLYDTFGDKWQLYCSSLRRYANSETQAHIAALKAKPRAIDGIRAMIERVVLNASQACLGVNSICEFGRSRKELANIHGCAERPLREAIVDRIREAQAKGDVAPSLDADEAAVFIFANFAGIRIAARGGARADQLQALGRLALRALR